MLIQLSLGFARDLHIPVWPLAQPLSLHTLFVGPSPVSSLFSPGVGTKKKQPGARVAEAPAAMAHSGVPRS